MLSGYETSPIKSSTSADRLQSASLDMAAGSQRGKSSPTSTEAGAGSPPEVEEQQSYRVTLSDEALRKLGLLKDQDVDTKAANNNGKKTTQSGETTSSEPESERLEYLKQRDREVRAHEQAHVIAGGSLVRGGASFGYATGPDGRLYAVSGEVSIDASPVKDDPEATVRKMGQVVKAALAPAQPSSQDRAVASSASEAQMQAQREISQQRVEDMQTGTGSEAGRSSTTTGASQRLASAPSPLVSKYINVQA